MVNFPKPLAEYDVQDLVPASVCDMFTVWLSITHPLFWIVSPQEEGCWPRLGSYGLDC